MKILVYFETAECGMDPEHCKKKESYIDERLRFYGFLVCSQIESVMYMTLALSVKIDLELSGRTTSRLNRE